MSTAFDRLHRTIQRVLWDMKWEELRDLQVGAINTWFDTDADFIVMANTASGKTEAAYLPVLSTLAPDHGAGSIRSLYVGPLKALINDQFRRVEDLCARAEIPVHRWHGDVGAGRKKDVVENPSGVLLITPESLEALFMRRGRELLRLFSRLDAIVIDELHAFLDGPRGRQLSSLLTRIDFVRQGWKRTRRIGLSATIGGIEQAQDWLGAGSDVRPVMVSSTVSQDIELLMKTYLQAAPARVSTVPAEKPAEEDSAEEAEVESSALISIAQHIHTKLRGRTNLVFGNSKARIEELADFLRRLSERAKLPNEFLVHHGSLSKEIREQVETELQSGRACTALCSSTLELGIDVGVVDAVGQVGPPWSVSSLKQRLGRSGRRSGQPSRLFFYVPLIEKRPSDPLYERLYPAFLQSVALVDLLLSKWVEPSFTVAVDYSTLVQQVLSLIVQYGGISAGEVLATLRKSEAFSRVTPEEFAQLLRDLGQADLIEQASDQDLILGLNGERLTSHYEFYAAFESAMEYEVLEGTHRVGSIDVIVVLTLEPGKHILLAGKRWAIVDVDHKRRVIIVKRARGKQPLLWSGEGGHIHPRIRERMRDLLQEGAQPSWMDRNSGDLLMQVRRTARETGLPTSSWIDDGSALFLFTWTGSRANHTLMLLARSKGLAVADMGIGLAFAAGSEQTVRAALRDAVKVSPSPEALVAEAFPKGIPAVGKHGDYLSSPLRARAYAAANLDMEGALEVLKR